MNYISATLPGASAFGTTFIHRLSAGQPKITVHRIQEEVARYYAIPLAEMTSQRRSREVARPRQVAMYLARELTPQSLPAIGRLFGWRDHTTVIHAVRTVEALMFDDLMMRQDIGYLKARLS